MQDEAKAQGTALRIDGLQLLPPEIRYYVLSYLAVEDLLCIVTVSKQWNIWAEDTYLWHKHFKDIALDMKAKDQDREVRLAQSFGWKSRYLNTSVIKSDVNLDSRH